ncbi:hypothetical protein BCR42DRAFT_399167 [Absidia repens]|uniref:Uncharacterized protein n=1 Tax=Absidia repens TaxID=90262 RepID=A0A1X2HE13_9FUNG|nr:hypothetical protein BCR42DRAFT_399167 [Absidia repens]
MAHSNIMTNQALDAYADSLFLEKQAKCWRAQVLKQQLVPNLIQLAHVTFGTRPNAATYETMAKNMIHLYQPIWRELERKDKWIEENAGGPAFPGPQDVELGQNSQLLNTIFGISDALGWAMN